MSPDHVGVRELRQNLSVYLERVMRGETLEVTDRGRPVAVLGPLPRTTSILDRLRQNGDLIPATGDLLALAAPRRIKGRSLRWASRALQRQRADRRL